MGPGLTMLHLTNGDCAAGLIRASGVQGEVVPWRDVLHEGPLPANLTLEEMSEVRARFIVGAEWAGSLGQVRQEFIDRDAALNRGLQENEIVLWFEADLYDQLQIIQILDWLALHRDAAPVLSMICIGEYPGIERFDGLGQLLPEQIGRLFPGRRPVDQPQLDLARHTWSAVTAPDPKSLIRMQEENTEALPFLRAALERLLQHFPYRENGLDRTENQALQAIRAGWSSFSDVFTACQAMEERVFLGDAVLWSRLERLSQGGAPAIAILDSVISLTSQGRAYLENRADYLRLNSPDRWVGGTHVTSDSGWRWDSARRTVRHFPT